MDEGWTNNPNIATSGYKMKFWHLLAMIAHIANTTQQNHKDITTKHNVPSQGGSLSSILVGQGQPYNSNHKPQWLINQNSRVWLGWSLIQCEQHNKNS